MPDPSDKAERLCAMFDSYYSTGIFGDSSMKYHLG